MSGATLRNSQPRMSFLVESVRHLQNQLQSFSGEAECHRGTTRRPAAGVQRPGTAVAAGRRQLAKGR